mmetsp:Transcript_2369/g.7847  ORF Transcript_2369/g.7847 Transcript_2369/m.7847 type:complete len:355 (-) Transcript_2369:475-1539(-)
MRRVQAKGWPSSSTKPGMLSATSCSSDKRPWSSFAPPSESFFAASRRSKNNPITPTTKHPRAMVNTVQYSSGELTRSRPLSDVNADAYVPRTEFDVAEKSKASSTTAHTQVTSPPSTTVSQSGGALQALPSQKAQPASVKGHVKLTTVASRTPVAGHGADNTEPSAHAKLTFPPPPGGHVALPPVWFDAETDDAPSASDTFEPLPWRRLPSRTFNSRRPRRRRPSRSSRSSCPRRRRLLDCTNPKRTSFVVASDPPGSAAYWLTSNWANVASPVKATPNDTLESSASSTVASSPSVDSFCDDMRSFVDLTSLANSPSTAPLSCARAMPSSARPNVSPALSARRLDDEFDAFGDV